MPNFNSQSLSYLGPKAHENLFKLMNLYPEQKQFIEKLHEVQNLNVLSFYFPNCDRSLLEAVKAENIRNDFFKNYTNPEEGIAYFPIPLVRLFLEETDLNVSLEVLQTKFKNLYLEFDKQNGQGELSESFQNLQNDKNNEFSNIRIQAGYNRALRGALIDDSFIHNLFLKIDKESDFNFEQWDELKQIIRKSRSVAEFIRLFHSTFPEFVDSHFLTGLARTLHSDPKAKFSFLYDVEGLVSEDNEINQATSRKFTQFFREVVAHSDNIKKVLNRARFSSLIEKISTEDALLLINQGNDAEKLKFKQSLQKNIQTLYDLHFQAKMYEHWLSVLNDKVNEDYPDKLVRFQAHLNAKDKYLKKQIQHLELELNKLNFINTLLNNKNSRFLLHSQPYMSISLQSKNEARANLNAADPNTQLRVDGNNDSNSFQLVEKPEQGQVRCFDLTYSNPKSQPIIARFTHAYEPKTANTPAHDIYEIKKFPASEEDQMDYSLKMALQAIINCSFIPSEKQPLVISGSNAEEVRSLWTAIMIIGKNNPAFKFNEKAIIVGCPNFNPKNEFGRLVGFKKDSLYSIWNNNYQNHIKEKLAPFSNIEKRNKQNLKQITDALDKTADKIESVKKAPTNNSAQKIQHELKKVVQASQILKDKKNDNGNQPPCP